MARIQPVNEKITETVTVNLLEAVRKKMGAVPNLISTMANSTAVANAYLGFSQALAGGRLSPRLREQIALVVGETNECAYCLAAHTALGRRAGLNEHETIAARSASASDPQERAALQFARLLVQNRGKVSDQELESLRSVGYSDGEICEIVANVSLNIFTNYFNHVAETEVDFPEPPALSLQAA